MNNYMIMYGHHKPQVDGKGSSLNRPDGGGKRPNGDCKGSSI